MAFSSESALPVRELRVMQPFVRDPYSVLGVGRNASPEELRNAFRRLARDHHPDRNPEDPDAQRRFQEINAAYQVLSDPDRRARYDRSGETSRAGSAPGVEFTDLSDLFADLFGGFVAPRAEQGDLQRVVDLAFEEAALGCSKSLSYERVDLCQECSGGGAEPGASQYRCPTCGGTGRVQLSAVGLFGLGGARPCPKCAGRGRIPALPCHVCSGSGLRPRVRKIEITIPPGIENGASQVIRGAGNRPAPAMPPGDLELVIRIREHKDFRREGDDIYSDLGISFPLAALGGEVEVTTLHGPAVLHIPPGTAHGEQLKLRGKGVPHRFRSGNGDHYVVIRIEIPKRVSKIARHLIEQLEEESPASDDAGFWDRMKHWFAG